MSNIRAEIKELRGKKVRLRDVASKTGFAISTVSRVLNGAVKVKPSTEDKIYGALKELSYPFNYSPTKVVDAQNEHRLIAFLTPAKRLQLEHETEVFELSTKTLRDVAEAHNYGMVIASYNNKEDPVVGNRLIQQKAIAGAILFRSLPEKDDFSEFSDAGIPFIVMNRVLDNTPYSYIGIDMFAVSTKMTQLLLNRGHKDIACLAYDGQNRITKKNG